MKIYVIGIAAHDIVHTTAIQLAKLAEIGHKIEIITLEQAQELGIPSSPASLPVKNIVIEPLPAIEPVAMSGRDARRKRRKKERKRRK